MTGSTKNEGREELREAFDHEIARHRERLVRLARRCGPPDEAEDAAHDAVVQALAGLKGFNGNARLGTWLHQVVVNASLMRWRKKLSVSKREVLAPSEDRDPVETFCDAGATAAEVLEQEERRRTVRRAIASLPENYRGAVELTCMDGRASEEAANELGISPNALRTRVSRARGQLAAALAAAAA